MLKGATLAIAAVLGTSALVTSQDPDLSKRVQELEKWKLTAEARIQALEGKPKSGEKPSASSPSAATTAAERVLTVAITNKRFDPSDAHSGKYDDNIWWNAEYTAIGLKKPARSIKGVLKFCDLFGDPRFQVRVTIDDPIKPEGKLKVEGVGIEYNQFLDTHKWLRSTEVGNMTFRFEVETVLYEDGTSERFGS